MASFQSQIQKLYENGVFLEKIPFSESEICDNIELSKEDNLSERIIRNALWNLLCIRFSKSEEEKLLVFEEPFMKNSYINGIDASKKLYCEAVAGGEGEVYAALKLAALCRTSSDASPVAEISICPNETTVPDINKMARRCCDFFSTSRRVIKFNFDFEGAYNEKVSCGKGDFLTKDGIWSISVSKALPSEFEFVLLAAQYVLGQHCHDAAKFRKIKNLGIFNPRLCRAFSVNVGDIPKDIISVLTKELY